jgi:hypothetical protein
VCEPFRSTGRGALIGQVYREAWPAERALALLDDDTGSAFDAECVAALRSIVAPKRPEPSPAGPVTPAARAAATPVPA